jgi:hypothetical protein
VNGGVGFSYFATNSSIKVSSGHNAFASTNNFDDITLAWYVGGVLIALSGRGVPVLLDLGARVVARTVHSIADRSR